ncbi:MAG: ATP-grasp domain-containing protein [Pseudomonadota bacterium]
MFDSCNILITSAGRRVALVNIFRKALQELNLPVKVVAVDMSTLSSACMISDASFVVPCCTLPEYVQDLLSLCEEQNVRLVIPTIDTELPALAANRSEFAAKGVTVAVSSEETIKVAGDKVATHEYLLSREFPTVRQALHHEVVRDLRRWSFPLIAKPRYGNSSRGVRYLYSPSELIERTDEDDYIIQAVAEGVEYTVDVYVDDAGRCRCAVPRQRIEVRAGEVSKAMTSHIPVLEDLATRVVEGLPGAYGVLNVQIFWDSATESATIIEINARFGGGYPLSDFAGAHFARWMIEELCGLPSTVSTNKWRSGIVMLRYDEAIFVEAQSVGLTA